MRRLPARSVGLVGVLVTGFPCLLWALSAQAESTKDSKPENQGNPLVHKLNAPVTLERGLDPIALREVMEFLGDRYSLTIVINSDAFKARGFENVEEHPVVFGKVASGVRLGMLLRMLVSQVQGTILVRPDFVEVIPSLASKRERVVQGRTPGVVVLVPLVFATFEKRPLAEALQELADLGDFSVVLDSRAEEQGQTAVTARLSSVPLDTAVQMLADMADLSSVLLDQVVYVTTKENAARLQAEPERQGATPPKQPKEVKPTPESQDK